MKDIRRSLLGFIAVVAIPACSHSGGGSRPLTPPAPTELTATAAGGQVVLAWTASQEPVTYCVLRSGYPGGPYTEVATGLELASYADRPLTEGRSHFYVVTASNRYGHSGHSMEVQAWPQPAVALPNAPGAPTAVAGDGRVTLSWPPVEGADAYQLRRSETAGGPYAVVPGTPVAASAMTDTGLTPGTTYYYVLAASNSMGTSPESPETSATPAAPVTVPAVLNGFVAVPGDTTVFLAWAPSLGASSYRVERSADSGGPYAELATVTTLTINDTGLENGKLIWYRITPVNSAGNGLPGVVESKPKAATSLPPSPTHLSANSGNGQVWISWTPSSGASGYLVYRRETTTFDFVPVGTVLDLRHPCFVESGLTNGMSSWYAVSAFNSAGEGPRSEQICSTPLASFPAPSGFSVYNGDTHIAIQWAPVPGASSYMVRRSPGGEIITERTTTDYDESGLTNGTSYSYVVNARNSDGESVNSQVVTAVPQHIPAGTCGLTGLEGTALLVMLALGRRMRRGGP